MPTYKFCCENCKKEIEIEKSINEYNPNENCPDCGQAMKRIFGAVNSIWKCSGAYGKNK